VRARFPPAVRPPVTTSRPPRHDGGYYHHPSWIGFSQCLTALLDSLQMSMQRLGQSLHDVARLVNLTALDRCGTAEGSADRLGQGFGAVNDE
jgi:hypothetical protein